MKWIVLALTLMISGSALARNTETVEEKRLGSWNLAAVNDKATGSFHDCMVHRIFRDEGLMIFIKARAKESLTVFGFISPRWKLEKGKVHTKIIFDDDYSFEFGDLTPVYDGEGLEIFWKDTAPELIQEKMSTFMKQVTSSSNIVIEIGRSRIGRFNLKGSRRAVDELFRCVKKHGRKQ